VTSQKSAGNSAPLSPPLTKQLVFHEMTDKIFSSQLRIKFQLTVEKMSLHTYSHMVIILLRLISLWWKSKGI